MAVLAWRSRPRSADVRVDSAPQKLCVPGAYAGRARFRPMSMAGLPPPLHKVIGQVADFGVAGLASAGDPFAGQRLFLEWCRDDLFGGFLIPEQDLEFLDPAR
jgi:hypothetical protein